MNLGFSQLLNSIHAELKYEHQLGAFVWIDKHFEGAHEKATLRFENTLVNTIERQDYVSAQSEGELYKNTILELLKKYKAHKNLGDQKSFLDSLSEST